MVLYLAECVKQRLIPNFHFSNFPFFFFPHTGWYEYSSTAAVLVYIPVCHTAVSDIESIHQRLYR